MPEESPRRWIAGTLTSAWIKLLGLSVASAILTLLPMPPALLGGGILLLALAKARIILARYLELSTRPAWLRGFTMVLTAFSVVIYGLYLI